MSILYLGDEHHRPIQDKHVEVLKNRELDMQVDFWKVGDLSIFHQLDALPAEPITMIGARLGAVPAVAWTARNPSRVRRLILLHPSLHLNLPYQPAPVPHFVPTLVLCHNKEWDPSAEQIADYAGKLFHEYVIHLTSEPPELRDTLTLLAL